MRIQSGTCSPNHVAMTESVEVPFYWVAMVLPLSLKSEFQEYWTHVGSQIYIRCLGLVEIAWRGTTDLHATMLSHSELGTTRFGTSVQISKKATGRVRSWREGQSNPSQIITYYDRVNNAKIRSYR